MDDSIFDGLDQITVLKGVLLAEQGRVLDEVTQTPLNANTSIFVGSVQGTRKSPYNTSVKVESRKSRSPLFTGVCSCPMSFNCKHVAALAFQLLSSGKLDAFILTGQSTYEQDSEALAKRPASRSASEQMPLQLADWLRRWTEMSFTLSGESNRDRQSDADQHSTVHASIRSEASKPAANALIYLLGTFHTRLIVKLGLVGVRKTGLSELYRPLSRSPSDIMRSRPAYLDPLKDVPILQLLHGFNLGIVSTFDEDKLEGPLLPMLFDRLNASGRTGIIDPKNPRAWIPLPLQISSDPLPFQLRWEPRDDKSRYRDIDETIQSRASNYRLTLGCTATPASLVLLPEPYAFEEQTLTLHPLHSLPPRSVLDLMLRMPDTPRAHIDHIQNAIAGMLPIAQDSVPDQPLTLQILNESPKFRVRITRLSSVDLPKEWPVSLPSAKAWGNPRVVALEMQYGTSEWRCVPSGSRRPAFIDVVDVDEQVKWRHTRQFHIEFDILEDYGASLRSASNLYESAEERFGVEPLAYTTERQVASPYVDTEPQSVMSATKLSFWPELLNHASNFAQRRDVEFMIDPDANFRTSHADTMQLHVSHGESGWFDVGYTLVFNGQSIALAPLLHRLVADNPDVLRPDTAQSPTEDFYVYIALEDPEGSDHFLAVPASLLKPAISTLHAFARRADGSVRVPRFELGRLMAQAQDMALIAPDDLRPLLSNLDAALAQREARLDPALKATLRPYQREGVAWLQLLDRLDLNGLLADDMGLGKTVQTLATLSADALLNPGCSLVVAPNSLVHNWVAETNRFLPHWNVLSVEAGQVFPDDQHLESIDLLVLPLSMVNRHLTRLSAVQWQWLVVDESQRIKNAGTRLAQDLKRLSSRRKLALSGTPLENHLGELWSQMDFLMPGLLGNLAHFEKYWRKPIEKERLSERSDALARRLRPFMKRRTKEAVAGELPPKTEQTLRIPMNAEQSQIYETVRALMDKKLRQSLSEVGFAKSQMLFLEALLRLRQVCCDPRLAGHTKAPSAKLEVLIEMLQTLIDEGRRVLVFSQFTEMLSLISQSLESLQIRHLLLTGKTNNRADIVEAFNRGEASVFLISLKAGGVGLNLTTADTVIMYEPWWNPAAEQQAIDRAHRIGQTQPVTVFRLIAEHSVEEKILALQDRKKDLAAQMLAGNKLEASLTEEDFTALLSD